MSDFRVDLMRFPEIALLLNQALPMGKVMNAIGMEMVDQIDRRFEKGVGPGGKAWPPSHRVKMNAGGKGTLENEGGYRESYNHESNVHESVIGSSFKWANTHHHGAIIKPKDAPYLTFKMPNGNWVRKKEVTIAARPVLGFDDQSERLILGVLNDAVNQYWGRIA